MYCWRSVWSVGPVGWLEIRILFLVLFLIDFFLVFRVCQNTHKAEQFQHRARNENACDKMKRKKTQKKRARCVLFIESTNCMASNLLVIVWCGLSTTNGIPMCMLIIFYLVMTLFKRRNSSIRTHNMKTTKKSTQSALRRIDGSLRQ